MRLEFGFYPRRYDHVICDLTISTLPELEEKVAHIRGHEWVRDRCFRVPTPHRDERGAVLGRQLLALSESEELVCFSVYGLLKAERIEPLFREFNKALAARLGVQVYNRSSNDYVIATILSHEWWDDSPMAD